MKIGDIFKLTKTVPFSEENSLKCGFEPFRIGTLFKIEKIYDTMPKLYKLIPINLLPYEQSYGWTVQGEFIKCCCVKVKG